MPRTTNSLIERVKSCCDNETYMFVFSGCKTADAYHKSILHSLWPTRILSKQYYSSEAFTSLSESKRKTMLFDGVYAYDGEELDIVTGLPTKTPKVYKYVVTNEIGTWESTTYTATYKSEDNGYGIIETYYEFKDPSNSYYKRKVMKRMSRTPCSAIYYKNKNGTWIDYSKYINSLPSYNIDEASITWPDIVKLKDDSILPKCRYVDSEGYVYDIDAGDGKEIDSNVTSLEIDINDTENFKYAPYSIDEPSLPISARHIMTDLKVTLPEDYSCKDFLVWLNGAFVPTIKDGTYDNIFYIKNGLSMVGSKCVNQLLDAPHEAGNNATVIEDESNNEYRYDANFRFIGWKGIKVSEFYKPISSSQINITYNFESIYIIHKIEFPVDINKNAHMIICNGKVLNEEEYEIDEKNPRLVILKNVESEGYKLLTEIVTDIKENPSFYEHVNPLKMVSRVLTNKTYSLVNFTSEDPEKEAKLLTSSACAIDFPYKNEVTFPSLSIGDVILTRGLYILYEWIHKNTISYPTFATSYNDGVVDKLEEGDVRRYYFILKDK